MEITEKQIKDLLEIEKAKSVLNDSDWNTYNWKNIKRLRALLAFVRSGVRFKYDLPVSLFTVSMAGTVLVEDKFVFSLLSNKWKVVGKNVWYRSRGPTHFIERFVRGNK